MKLHAFCNHAPHGWLNTGIWWVSLLLRVIWISGAGFPIHTKNSGTFETGEKWWKNYLKKFPENPETDKNVGNLGRIIKRKGNFQKKKRFKHFDIFHGPLKIPGYAVRFCTGNFWKFKPEFLVKWKALLITVTMNVRL